MSPDNEPVEGIEPAPEPMGAKQTAVDPREQWREERASLGGFMPPIEFTEQQRGVINAVADTIIPPGGGFPAPSEVDVVDFFARYVTPADREVKWFPMAGEATFKKQLDDLGSAFADSSPDERTAALSALEEGDDDEQAFFIQLRALSYYGYYARPEVTAAIRDKIPAADDYHGPPQPYGYLGKVEPWPEGMFDHGHGSYIATEDIVRVDIPDDIKAEYGVTS